MALTQTLSFVIRGSDRYSPTFAKFARDLDSVGKRAEHVGWAMQRMGYALAIPAGVGAFGAGLHQLPGQLMRVDHAMRQIQVIGDLTESEMRGISRRVRQIARETNQDQESIIAGLNDLVAKTGDPVWSLELMSTIGKTATATSTSITDLATLAFTTINAGKVAPHELMRAFEAMTQAGKMGSFELRAMASEFPEILAAGRWLGATGVQGVARFAAAMQIAKRATPNDPEAVTGVRAFLNELRSGSTVSAFRGAGFDLVSFIREGMKDPSRDMLLEIIEVTNQLTKQDPFLSGQLFNNVRTQRFLAAMQQNVAEYKKIRDVSSATTGIMDRDFTKMMNSMQEQVKQFRIQISNFGFTVFLGPLQVANRLMRTLNDSAFAAQATVLGLGGALVASGILVYTGLVVKSLRDVITLLKTEQALRLINITVTNAQILREGVRAALASVTAMALGSPMGAIGLSVLAGLGVAGLAHYTGLTGAVARGFGAEEPPPSRGSDAFWVPGATPWEAGRPMTNEEMLRVVRTERENPGSINQFEARRGQIDVNVRFQNPPAGTRVDTVATPGIVLTQEMGRSFPSSSYAMPGGGP